MRKSNVPFRNPEAFGLQRRVVSHMTSTSWQNIPHVSYLYEPDVTEFYEEFRRLAAEKGERGKKLSFNTILLRVVAEGLKSCPELNSHIEYLYRKGEGSIHICGEINITVPWLLPDGGMITLIAWDSTNRRIVCGQDMPSATAASL